MNRRTGWLFFGVLLLGIALRLVVIQTRSIAYDDAFSIFLAERSLPAIVSGTAADTMPPLYYFLLHFWMQLGGEGLGWLRLLSVLLNLGSIAALFGLVRSLAGDTAGLCAAFLAAISPLQIYHAQDLRMYALLSLAQICYCWFFVRAWKKPERQHAWGDWLGLVLCGAVAMYTHNLAIFVLVLPDAFLLVRREGKRLVKLLAAQVVIGLLALPWLGMIPGQIAKIQHAFWTPRPGVVEILQAMMMPVANLPLPGIWLAIGMALALLVAVLIAMESIRLIRQKQFPGFLGFLAFLPPVLLFVASYVMRPVFVTRGFLAATLGYLGMAGVIVARRWPKLPAGLLLACFVGGAAIGLTVHYTFEEFPRSPFQDAMQALQTQVQPGDRIIHDNKLSYFPSLYYNHALPQSFLADEPGSPNDTLAPESQAAMDLYPQTDIAAAVGDAGRVYFVVFQTTIDEYKQSGQGDHPQLAWLKSHYPLVAESRYNDLLVFQFER
jgi:mannosyltransferase